MNDDEFVKWLVSRVLNTETEGEYSIFNKAKAFDDILSRVSLLKMRQLHNKEVAYGLEELNTSL